MSDQPEATEREQEEASEGRQQEQEAMAAHGLEASTAKPPTPGRRTGLEASTAKPPTPGRKTGPPSAPLAHDDPEAASDEDGEQ